MTESNIVSLEDLMTNLEVKRVIDSVNQEMTERRQHVPMVCDVFGGSYTRLTDDDTYRFNIDREAAKHYRPLLKIRFRMC